MYSQITGSIPVRTDVDLSGAAWSDGQREAAAGAEGGRCKSKRVLLSLAHNMAQPNQHHRGHDRRAHRVRAQQHDDARAGDPLAAAVERPR